MVLADPVISGLADIYGVSDKYADTDFRGLIVILGDIEVETEDDSEV